MSPTPAVELLDERVDHVRRPAGAALILEYGDYECPYSRQAFRAIERVERERDGGVRLAFRNFPLTRIHPHALAAAAAAEAASLPGRPAFRLVRARPCGRSRSGSSTDACATRRFRGRTARSRRR